MTARTATLPRALLLARAMRRGEEPRNAADLWTAAGAEDLGQKGRTELYHHALLEAGLETDIGKKPFTTCPICSYDLGGKQ